MMYLTFAFTAAAAADKEAIKAYATPTKSQLVNMGT